MHRLLAAAFGLLAGAALAHPHGRMDCAAEVGAADGRLAWVDLRLTLDGSASQALRPRVALHGDADAPAQAANFNRVLWGLLRQSDWMLAVRGAGAGTGADAPALAWDDGDSAHLVQDPGGRLQVRVRLRPAAPGAAPSLQALQLECRDPTWYWLAGFSQPAQVGAPGTRCQAELGERHSVRSQALALQAAALAAGRDGADRMDASLVHDDAALAARAWLRCDATSP